MTTSEYEQMTDEQLVDLSAALYQDYLDGEDTLTELHAIAEVLRMRNFSR